jgi:hypothetical protein
MDTWWMQWFQMLLEMGLDKFLNNIRWTCTIVGCLQNFDAVETQTWRSGKPRRR